MKDLNLVCIGHVGFDNILININKQITHCGRAGYYTALAGSLFSKKVGLVSRIGSDFDINKLKKLGIDLKGVKIISNGLSPQFKIRYHNSDYKQRFL